MKPGNYFPSQGRNIQLLDQIISAEDRIYKKLKNLNLNSLDISDYNKRYLLEKLRDGALDIYCQILYLSLCRKNIPFQQITLVDYGGGCGVMSFFAKELGIGKVIYDDIYDVSCSDVNIISRALGLGLDHIVCGDANDLVLYINKNKIIIDIIVSYDVLEHIYNLKDHFIQMSAISDEFRLVYGSSANIKNPRVVNRIQKLHKESEYENRNIKWGNKERDSLRAYADIRKEMITNYSPALDKSKVEMLSKMTRGLFQPDIYKCIDEYNKTGRISYKPDHPSNTCDPYNGNWKEHLIDQNWLENVLNSIGYNAEILHGYYNLSGSKTKRYLKTALNNALKFLGKKALIISPHILLCADFNANNANAVTNQKSKQTVHSPNQK